MAHLLSNIFTKNYWNRTTIVEIIIGGWVVSFFEAQCIIVNPVLAIKQKYVSCFRWILTYY